MSIPAVVHDARLAKIATCTRLSICSAEPANYAGIAAVSLGSKVLTAGAGNGDWTIEAGDPSGRRLVMEEQTGLAPTSDGAVNFYAYDDGTTLLSTVPTAAPHAVTTTETWKCPATVVLESPDPTYA